MLKIVEIIVGLLLFYYGLSRTVVSVRLQALVYGLIGALGLVLAIHGVLIYNVPHFFSG